MATGTITVSLGESADETYGADYFQIADGWMTLKARGGKTVASFPQSRVTRVLTTMCTLSAAQQQSIIDGEDPEVAYKVQFEMNARHDKEYADLQTQAVAAQLAQGGLGA